MINFRRREAILKCIGVCGGIVPAVMRSSVLSSDSFGSVHSERELGLTALGDGRRDATSAIQSLIDSFRDGGGEISIPSGTYSINADIGVSLHSGVHLKLASDAILVAQASKSASYAVIRIVGVKDASVIGGRIRGDRDIHIGAGGEWGMGVLILGSENITISNVSASGCWGDGFYIGSLTRGRLRSLCRGVNLIEVISTNNRRQGLSITGCQTAKVIGSSFSSTGGTPPSTGIDLEPNASDLVDDVLIENCIVSNNTGFGIVASKGSSNIEIANCTISENGKYGIYLAGARQVHVFRNNVAGNRHYDIVVDAKSKDFTLSENSVTKLEASGSLAKRVLVQKK
ncbi:right-handed parallel beta-helix repeat-containing protein [Rhodanobacter ginsengiterrae]|uniref:right-handed parallel beta-helix repeat-containing protein n=1 Tax=Rhodanobacter ginsengiterrae TaxID=2008451 RepID=UPI003CE719BE